MDSRWTIQRTDARAGLEALPAQSVHFAMTSPPYFGLRSYSTEPQVWGGDPECRAVVGGHDDCGHRWEPTPAFSVEAICLECGARVVRHEWADERVVGLGKGHTAYDGQSRVRWQNPIRQGEVAITFGAMSQGAHCLRCSAWRGELGSEPDVDSFVSHLVEVFRELRRVLRDDGTLVVNLSDSYSGSGKGPTGHNGIGDQGQRQGFTDPGRVDIGVPERSLLMVPDRFGLAMLRDGWVLRARVRWLKRSAMPEALNGWRWERHRVKVTGGRPKQIVVLNEQGWNRHGDDIRDAPAAEWQDCPGCPTCIPNDGLILRKAAWRPTSAVEECFVFSKAGMDYFGDAEAAKVLSVTPVNEVRGQKLYSNPVNGPLRNMNGLGASTLGGGNPTGANPRNYLLPADIYDSPIDDVEAREWGLLDQPSDALLLGPEPFAEAHFATYPVKLCKFFIAPLSPERCCAECGAGWAPVVEREGTYPERKVLGYDKAANWWVSPNAHNSIHPPGMKHDLDAHTSILGFRPTCAHLDAPTRPSVILDPFSGSGTTGLAALALGRSYVGLELSEQYVEMSRRRIRRATEFGFRAEAAASDDLGPLFAGLGPDDARAIAEELVAGMIETLTEDVEEES